MGDPFAAKKQVASLLPRPPGPHEFRFQTSHQGKLASNWTLHKMILQNQMATHKPLSGILGPDRRCQEAVLESDDRRATTTFRNLFTDLSQITGASSSHSSRECKCLERPAALEKDGRMAYLDPCFSNPLVSSFLFLLWCSTPAELLSQAHVSAEPLRPLGTSGTPRVSLAGYQLLGLPVPRTTKPCPSRRRHVGLPCPKKKTSNGSPLLNRPRTHSGSRICSSFGGDFSKKHAR